MEAFAKQAFTLLKSAAGADEDSLGAGHMAVRAFIIYFSALLMVRFGEKRFLGKSTAFDVILGVMLGSVLSRGITNAIELPGVLTAGVVLVSLHWGLAKLAFRSNRIGDVLKGHTRVIVRNGKVDWTEMRKGDITEQDLRGALRLQASLEGWDQVKEARLERSGKISVVKKSQGD
jgi:uncharacterized membrane protein YcaP (DUF421 family)